MKSLLLCCVAHAQHSVGEVPVVPKCTVRSQELLIVPGLQKLLEEVIPVQTWSNRNHNKHHDVCLAHEIITKKKTHIYSPKGPLMQDTQLKKDWQDLSMLNAIQYLRLLMKLI